MVMFGVAIITIMLGISLAYDCGDFPDTDGCSVWTIVPYKSTFQSSCHKHDVCYSCGRTFGMTRNQCDKKFNSDMNSACKNGWWCKLWAYIYYKVVDLVAHKHYEISKKDWCKDEPWYKTECMP